MFAVPIQVVVMLHDEGFSTYFSSVKVVAFAGCKMQQAKMYKDSQLKCQLARGYKKYCTQVHFLTFSSAVLRCVLGQTHWMYCIISECTRADACQITSAFVSISETSSMT